MPLVRYEVRCEHSLANPELYRTAGRDDSEGLLEGVAMAGLVGIVRQLGDLAEFAAEIFHDLHDDIMTIVSRGQNLKARVARLEVDLPAVEKALLAEASQFRFAYSARSKWRAPLPMDQNLCAQGELPRFVRNFYDDCRGPPRLFLLDKFDEAGKGACVKRYTDPTFFRISWATMQIERADQLRREQEAQLEKKNLAADKGSDNPGPKIYARERLSSALFENLEGFTGDFTPELRSRRLDRVLEIPTEGDLTPDGPRSPEEPRSPQRETGLKKRPHLPEVAQGPVLAPLKISVKDIENAKMGRRNLKPHEEGTLSDEEEEESSADFYVDALTTMGSDPDSEPGSRGRWDADSAQSRFASESDQVTSLNHSVLKAHVEAHRLTPPGGSEADHNDDFARRLGLQEHESPVAAIDTVEWGSEAGESPHAQPSFEDEEPRSVDESIAMESVASVDSRNDLANVPDEDVHEKKPLEAQMPVDLPDKVPHQPPDKVPAHKVHDKVSDKASNKVPDIVPNKVSDKVPEKPTFQSHESVSLLDSYRVSARVKEQRASVEARAQTPPESDRPPEAEENHPALASVNVKQIVEQNVEQIVTTPRSRRLWAKDNGSEVTSSILSVKNGGSELSNILRARMLESSGSSHEDLTSIVPLEGEDSAVEILERRGHEVTYRSSSSNPSSPYTNISSSDVAEEDGYSSSASSSPKGANFGALLSPSESPPRIGRGLMGSPKNYDANPPFGRKSPNLAPPITPFLSSSPSVSRSPSINDQPSVSSVAGRGHSPRLPPQLIRSPQRDITLRNSLPSQTSNNSVTSSANDSEKNVPLVSPRRVSENGSSLVEPSRIQPSALPNPVPRPRTWVDRSESNVAATLRAIRQAAAVESDDETGSECPSDCS
ncbi:hypothetical protein KC19_6G050200 [Ceratodon purpureus]|uniref:Protein SCAR n=1 Tax=Ceratodon purpureus TaxID=3225 RepID=A0A8T0HHX3_CERPU|nr:hypothetical protein KC19_6G050200 [Ceratodon purpureus]